VYGWLRFHWQSGLLTSLTTIKSSAVDDADIAVHYKTHYSFQSALTPSSLWQRLQTVDVPVFLSSQNDPVSERQKFLTNPHINCYFLKKTLSLLSFLTPLFLHRFKNKTISVAISPQANSTHWATAIDRWILVPTFADGVVSLGQRGGTPTAVNLFPRPEPLILFQVATHLCSRDWMGPVPDPLVLRKYGSGGNRMRDLWVCSQNFWQLDHRGSLFHRFKFKMLLSSDYF
jgi:hypothetical protein